MTRSPRPPVNGPPPPDPVDDALAAARPEDRPALAREVSQATMLGAVLGVPPAPVTIGGWTVERLVGEGGMGSVYRASGPDGRPVALKLLRQEGDDAGARFLREAALLRRVSHPRVVRYVDHGVTPDGQRWLVMEWLEGEDLARRLRRGPLAVEDALRLILLAAEGLAATHRAGVLHRDVKPANLFLPGGGLAELRVVDFGVARVADPTGTRLTSTGSVLGTTQYMAPEQIDGRPEVRSDVYGLGAVLYECLVGEPPYTGDSPAAVLARVLSAPVPSVAARRPDAPPPVDALVGRMLAKDPAARPADMDAVALEVAGLLAGTGPRVALSRAERPAVLPPTSTVPGTAAGEALVGRARELARARGVVAHTVEEGVAALVVVTGPRGVGRSALLSALDAPGARMARAAPDERGVPFALLRRLLARDGAPPDWLRIPPGDPRVAADRIRLAWHDQLDAWRDAPTLLLVDDAHLADLSSLGLLAVALTALHDAPFAVVITAPDGPPPPLDGVGAELVALGPLGERSARQLVARWFPGREDELVARGGGLPGELWRLGRGDAGWARLDDLPPERRRVARACALVGDCPWPEAVGALLGVEVPALAPDLDALVDAGLLDAGGGLRWVSAAARAAVLDTCTDADRRRGAEAMVGWLADRDRPGERAEHLLTLGDPVAATHAFLQAARDALVGEDAALADRWLARARATGALGGAVALCAAQLHFWRGRVAEATAEARDAIATLAPGGDDWFEAASLVITAAGQRGDHPTMDAAVAQVLAAPGGDARVVALCRAVSQRATVEGSDAESLAAEALATPARSAEARAWQARARAARASVVSFDASIDAQLEAHEAHLRAEDPRAAALIGLYLGSWYVWSGAWERADAVIRDSLRAARRLGADYLVLWGRYVHGKLLVEIGDPRATASGLEQVAEEARSSPRIRAGALLYAALAALRAGEIERAEALAAESGRHPGVERAARAAQSLARLAGGAPVGGLGAELLPDDGARLVEWDELVHLAAVEVTRAAGGDARAAAIHAADRIRARAATLADPLRRHDYLGRPHLVRRTLELEAELRR